MKWIKNHWQWAVLNLVGLVVLAGLLRPVIAAGGFVPAPRTSPLLVDSGKWAIRFLLFCLSMTPLHTLLGWRSAAKLRKPAGLWAFEFGALHFLANVAWSAQGWLYYPIPDYMAALGVVALSILGLMALTSSRWAMKQLGKWWKRLHRLVYAAGILIALHALLEVPNKRVAIYDSQAGNEIWIYALVMVALLIVRIPRIRTTLVDLLRHRQGSVSPVEDSG